MSELPKGWRHVRLIDAGTWLSGGTPSTDDPRYWNGDIPWISAASLKNFRINSSDRRVTQAGAKAGTRIVQEGTVLFVVRGMSLKNEFRVGVAQRELTFGQDCKAIIPHPEVDGTFLALALKARTPQILSMADEAGHGTGRLPTDLISRLVVGVPSLAEQRRVAEILDSVDNQIRAGELLVTKLELLRTAVVRQQLQLLDRAGRLTVSDFFGLQAGITLGPLRKPTRQVHRYLRVANVQRGRIDLSDIAALEASPTDERKYGLAAGDLLVVEGHASPDAIGRCALVRNDAKGLLYQNHLFRLRSDLVEPEFGEIWLNSDAIRSYWRRMCATSSGLYTINSKLLAKAPFPVVDREGQLRIVQAQRTTAFRIAAELRNLEKLKSLKLGLMDDLLTGRVRLPVE